MTNSRVAVLAAVFLAVGGLVAVEAVGGELAIRWEVVDQGVSGEDGTSFHRPPVHVRVFAEGGGASPVRLEWTSDGSTWQPVADEIVTTAESVTIRAVGEGGEVVTTVASWRLDGKGPVIWLELHEEEIGVGGEQLEVRLDDEVDLLVCDAGSGVDTVRGHLGPEIIDFTMTGGGWQPDPTGLRFTIKGKYQVQVEATDRLGNTTRQTWKAVVKGARRRD